MTATIRFATPADAGTIHQLIRRLAAYEREPDAVEVEPETLRRQLASAAPPFECLLAERDGRGVGFALFFHNYSTWRGKRGLYLEDLYVVEEERGGGIGGALLRRLAQVAAERDCARLELVVLDWNEPAIGFYRSLGGELLSDWRVVRFTGDALERLGREPG